MERSDRLIKLFLLLLVETSRKRFQISSRARESFRANNRTVGKKKKSSLTSLMSSFIHEMSLRPYPPITPNFTGNSLQNWQWRSLPLDFVSSLPSGRVRNFLINDWSTAGISLTTFFSNLSVCLFTPALLPRRLVFYIIPISSLSLLFSFRFIHRFPSISHLTCVVQIFQNDSSIWIRMLLRRERNNLRSNNSSIDRSIL